jgi:aminoglycoside phosphotransferase (APT) family kinase protein
MSSATTRRWKAGQLRPLLESVVHGPVSRIHRAPYGNWSVPYFFSANDREYVLRLSRQLIDFEKDELIYRLAGRTLPVPRTVAIGEVSGGHFSVTERLHGRHLDLLPQPDIIEALPIVVRLVDGIANINIDHTTGCGPWAANRNGRCPSWQSFLADVMRNDSEQRIHGWRRRFERDATTWRNFMRTVELYLPLVAQCPEHRRLIHGDLLNHNLLMCGAQRVSGIIDWGWSKYGDPLYDMARLGFWAKALPRWRGIDFDSEIAGAWHEAGLPYADFHLRMRCYKIHAGLISQQHHAFKGNWRMLRLVSRRTLGLALGG